MTWKGERKGRKNNVLRKERTVSQSEGAALSSHVLWDSTAQALPNPPPPPTLGLSSTISQVFGLWGPEKAEGSLGTYCLWQALLLRNPTVH